MLVELDVGAAVTAEAVSSFCGVADGIVLAGRRVAEAESSGMFACVDDWGEVGGAVPASLPVQLMRSSAIPTSVFLIMLYSY